MSIKKVATWRPQQSIADQAGRSIPTSRILANL